MKDCSQVNKLNIIRSRSGLDKDTPEHTKWLSIQNVTCFESYYPSPPTRPENQNWGLEEESKNQCFIYWSNFGLIWRLSDFKNQDRHVEVLLSIFLYCFSPMPNHLAKLPLNPDTDNSQGGAILTLFFPHKLCCFFILWDALSPSWEFRLLSTTDALIQKFIKRVKVYKKDKFRIKTEQERSVTIPIHPSISISLWIYWTYYWQEHVYPSYPQMLKPVQLP